MIGSMKTFLGFIATLVALCAVSIPAFWAANEYGTWVFVVHMLTWWVLPAKVADMRAFK